MSTLTSNESKRCGVTEWIVFLLALATGTACSICSKVMMGMRSVGMTGEIEVFDNPIFQTFSMFVWMTLGLVFHGLIVYFRIPFPGYHHHDESHQDRHNRNHASPSPGVAPVETDPLLLLKNGNVNGNGSIPDQKQSATANPTATANTSSSSHSWKLYWELAIPSIFDLGATVLCMMGLRFLDVSIYQLLRGSGIIFVALLKQSVLRHRLYRFQWIGVMWNSVAVLLVGLAAVLDSQDGDRDEAAQQTTTATTSTTADVVWGVGLVLAGAFVQALQYVVEEKMMTGDTNDEAEAEAEAGGAPPLLLIGMEGLWGTVLCLAVVYPIAHAIPGDDHGSYEHFHNTFVMISNSVPLQRMLVVYFFAIFGYNVFAILVTYLMNSIWHAILDNFRPITIWMTDLFLYYVVIPSMVVASSSSPSAGGIQDGSGAGGGGGGGEAWDRWSYIQLAGMAVLLYGTAIYNGPNDGSILLNGKWYVLGLDCRGDYESIRIEREEAEADAEWERKLQQFRTGPKRSSAASSRRGGSFLGDRSPFLGRAATAAAAGVGGMV